MRSELFRRREGSVSSPFFINNAFFSPFTLTDRTILAKLQGSFYYPHETHFSRCIVRRPGVCSSWLLSEGGKERGRTRP